MNQEEPVIESARSGDLLAVARIFRAAFAESLEHLFGEVPDLRLLEEVFRLCRQADPAGLLVARQAERVLGYIYVPLTTSELRRLAFTDGYLWRMARIWLESDRHHTLRPLVVLALDKYHFLRSDWEDGVDGEARILSLAVTAAARGRGLGSRLVQRGLARLADAGVRQVRLEVRPDNQPARRIYAAAGFVTVGETEDSRGPWLIMRKEL